MNKGLVELEKLENDKCYTDYEYRVAYDVIRKELKDKEQLEIMYSNCIVEGAKQKKALEIIKKKRVDTQVLFDTENFNDYNWFMAFNRVNKGEDRYLTEEEYNLLKGLNYDR